MTQYIKVIPPFLLIYHENLSTQKQNYIVRIIKKLGKQSGQKVGQDKQVICGNKQPPRSQWLKQILCLLTEFLVHGSTLLLVVTVGSGWQTATISSVASCHLRGERVLKHFAEPFKHLNMKVTHNSLVVIGPVALLTTRGPGNDILPCAWTAEGRHVWRRAQILSLKGSILERNPSIRQYVLNCT